MDVKQAHEWSRHYDTTLWTVASILITAMSGLIVYMHSVNKFNRWLPLLGVLLTILSVFFASSFRVLRCQINEYLTKYAPEDVKFLRSHRRMFRQWYVYLAIHGLMLFLCFRLLICKDPEYGYLWWPLGVVFFAFLIVWGRKADHMKPGNMECVKVIVDPFKLKGIIPLPEEMMKCKVEVIVLPTEEPTENSPG